MIRAEWPYAAGRLHASMRAFSFVLAKMILERTRSSTAWAVQFAASRSEADVVRIANEYLATWLPSDFESLPAECRVGVLTNADELAHAAVTFTQCELQVAPHGPAAAILTSLSEVFIAAQVRVRQLRSPRFDPSAA
jgi:hypothetical protein